MEGEVFHCRARIAGQPCWNDQQRFSQTGYSAPTEWPEARNYKDLTLFLEDMIKAVTREQSHREWLEDERRDRAYERERDSEED